MAAVGAGEDGEADETRRAVTLFRVVGQAGKRAAWVALQPLTGRTHQLRAHCAAIGTPILGDGKYGGKAAFIAGAEIPARLQLHARRLILPHPDGTRRPLDITAPPPPHMTAALAWFGFAPGDARGRRADGLDEPMD
jgi:23S rRNA pseudouridine955/2504/2580 synthase